MSQLDQGLADQLHHHHHHHHNHLDENHRDQGRPFAASSSPSMDSSFQDSPTIGRAQVLVSGSSTTTSSRSRPKPAPSPLHSSSQVSPPTSPKTTYTSASVPRIVTTGATEDRHEQASEKTYYNSDSSDTSTPEERSSRPVPSAPSQQTSNESRTVSDTVVAAKPPSGGSSLSQFLNMAGPSGSRDEPAKGAPRNSSMDSAISAISSSSAKGSQDPNTEIAHLIKTAGSAEAVIQYLLKEKNSQAQQNSQLWRLVDKQRAMILGLNKDLERALKDKEKYRKKLKEILGDPGVPAVPPFPPKPEGAKKLENLVVESSLPKERVLEVPVSPGLDSDSHKASPIDVSMAPYPITPPADQPTAKAAPSVVSELLDPSHSMPKASEHALDQFDHDAQEREAEEAARREAERSPLHINLAIPPSRSTQAPREPPARPPPQLPVGLPPRSPKPEEGGASQFPLPPAAPPPRRPPPAPLQLKNTNTKPSAAAKTNEPETDSDYDDILEVNEIPREDQRGRRRTREEDEREREILALKEAEMRSLSKKSKQSSSQKGTPKKQPEPPQMPPPQLPQQSEPPVSPRNKKGKVIPQPLAPASLAGVLSGNADAGIPSIALMSPGLPSSPRPMPLKSPVTSPPLSPLGVTSFAGVPLSPRPPRGPIPLPPNTPLMTPSPPGGEPLALSTPKPLLIVKQGAHSISEPSPTKSTMSTIDSPLERTRVFKGFISDEYPDLLLPPNALPHINIKVASSRMKPSRASLLSLTQYEEDPVFTLAIYARADGGELWRVEKDSASFAKMDHRLKQCSAFTAKTPDRSLFSGHAPAKLDARRIALNNYLDELLNTPLDTNTAIELCKYLSTNTLPPNADETGSSTGEANPESQRTGPGGRPYRNGYLTKRGKNFGGWKARYFVLDGPLLKYYETPGGAHLGTIKLQKAQIGKQSHHPNEGSPARNPSTDDSDNQYRHAFLILERKKKDPNSMTRHVLCAESDRERDSWVDALLRWVDYEDPEDEDAKKDSSKKELAHDRHGSGHATNGKKKMHGKHPQQSADDGLIGVSYDNTKQGDAPSSKGDKDHESTHSQSTSSSYTISAPRDPQVLSGSGSWGDKISMAQAQVQAQQISQEEKKARKRSFFGFGPKTRISSDGQDSLFGSDGGSISGGQGGHQYNGPVHQVFGAPLSEAVRYCAPVDVRVPLPAVVYRCIQFLEHKNAISEEGIFRLSGSNVTIKQLKERFNTEGDINLITDETFYDIHAVASLLKLYLRELPSTILTNDLRLDFINAMEMGPNEKIPMLVELVERLPQANAALLKYLISFLIKIIDHASVNKMTVRNVGIVFSPTLNIPAPIFATFLQNFKPIFGIDPSEYELPVTEPDHLQERRPSLPTSFHEQARRPSDGRPSTSHSTSHNDSPHRHRLMESLDSQASRNTPTPPPMTMQQMAQMNAATFHSRSTPTPPPQQRQVYEPQLSQLPQGAQAQYPMRPAYETVPTASANFDIMQQMMQQQQQQQQRQQTPPGMRQANPGYDRPIYENGLSPAPYEHSYKNRRESTMFMGSLNQQPSKSRLRE
ncbi:putative GTPase-activating protein [Podospora fimiseda]|uniref:GTPase-activating protein n=1 Tax=Podospora fimiseda TaxID=252190 RepID=A0AAN7H5V1_9PEZI|nr:putative GTPase-activating protein [Podospora fimiseda]